MQPTNTIRTLQNRPQTENPPADRTASEPAHTTAATLGASNQQKQLHPKTTTITAERQGANQHPPADRSASAPAHTAAMELEPCEASVSACSRTMNGKSSASGITAASAFSARAPWPTSRLLAPEILPTSFTANGGKLRRCRDAVGCGVCWTQEEICEEMRCHGWALQHRVLVQCRRVAFMARQHQHVSSSLLTGADSCRRCNTSVTCSAAPVACPLWWQSGASPGGCGPRPPWRWPATACHRAGRSRSRAPPANVSGENAQVECSQNAYSQTKLQDSAIQWHAAVASASDWYTIINELRRCQKVKKIGSRYQ